MRDFSTVSKSDCEFIGSDMLSGKSGVAGVLSVVNFDTTLMIVSSFLSMLLSMDTKYASRAVSRTLFLNQQPSCHVNG